MFHAWTSTRRAGTAPSRNCASRPTDALDAAVLRAAGIARQRQAIVHGLRESVKDFNDGVSEIGSRECAPPPCPCIPEFT